LAISSDRRNTSPPIPLEAAAVSHQFIENVFPVVAERRMAKIVSKRREFHEIAVDGVALEIAMSVI
jgi:hypothetical protein